MIEMTWRELRDNLNTLNNRQLDQAALLYLDWNNSKLGLLLNIESFADNVKGGNRKGSGNAMVFITLEDDDLEFLKDQVNTVEKIKPIASDKVCPSLGIYDYDLDSGMPFLPEDYSKPDSAAELDSFDDD